MGITGITNPIKILCIDDENNVLRSLKRLFLDEDYEVLTATSGKEGLELLEQELEIQIVISDYRMPEMNGVDFLREVFRRWPKTVRIVLSGYADTASIVSAINEGQIYKFIPKPWNDDELKVTIANAIDLYYLHRENEELLIRLQQTNDELSHINESLEERVADRTARLEFKNRVLKSAQNILNVLPVGVLGIDNDDVVVYCNNIACNLIEGGENTALGTNWRVVLPSDITNMIEPLMTKDNFSKQIKFNGQNIRIKGKIMKEPDQEGRILIFDAESKE